MPALFDKVLRAGEGKILRKLAKTAEAVNSLEEDYVDLTDAELRALTDEFKERYADGESLDDLLPEAFAAVREAAARTLGHAPLRRADHGRRAPAPRQHRRDEDRRGQDPHRHAAGLPQRARRRGVHVVTVNDYLASYESD